MFYIQYLLNTRNSDPHNIKSNTRITSKVPVINMKNVTYSLVLKFFVELLGYPGMPQMLAPLCVPSILRQPTHQCLLKLTLVCQNES